MLKKFQRDRPPPPPDDERCTRNDGKKWRCRQSRAAGQSMCDYHLQYQRSKYRSWRRLCRFGDQKRNISRKDEVKNGMKSSRPVNLKPAMDESISTKESTTGQIIEKENGKDKKPREGKSIGPILSKEWLSHFCSDGESDDEEISTKGKSIFLQKVEDEGKPNGDLSGVEYKSSIQKDPNNEENPEEKPSSIKRSDIIQIVERGIGMSKMPREGKCIGLISSKERLSYFCSDDESDSEEQIEKKRKSASLEVEKVENKGKQNNNLSGIDYKLSIQMSLNNDGNPEVEPSNIKRSDMVHIVENEINKSKMPREGKSIWLIPSKERLIYFSSDDDESDGEEQIGEKRKSASLEVEKVENKGKLNSHLSGIYYKSSIQKGLNNEEKPEEGPSSIKRCNMVQIVENEISRSKMPRERKSIGLISSKERLSYFCSDDEFDGEEQTGKRRKSVSLEVEKVENKGKNNSHLSDLDYKSSIQMCYNKEKPEVKAKLKHISC